LVPTSGAVGEPGTVSLVGLATLLLRRLRLLVAGPAVGFILALLLVVLGSRRYAAESTFFPQRSSNAISRLTGLAAQFGINVAGMTEGEDSPQLYAELVRSRALLGQVGAGRYRFPIDEVGSDTLDGTLVELYDIKAKRSDQATRAVIGRLMRDVAVRVDLDAGFVRVRVTAPWPGLASQLNRRVLDLVNEFNLQKRQAQAVAEREFVEGRLNQARRELEEAEADLQRFLENNRIYQNSPELVVEYERLQRRVNLHQQVHTSLAQAYEQSRIDAVRNTPVIVIVDEPEGAARPAGRRVLKLAMGIVLGGMVSVLAVLGSEFARLQRELQPAEFEELDRVRQGLRPRGLLGRLRSR